MNLNRPPRFPRFETGVPLTKKVQGQKASDLEERWSRSLDKLNRDYYFQFIIPAYEDAPYGTAGEVHLDFIDITDSIPIAFAIDEIEFIHASAEQKARDAQDDIKIANFFAEYGGVVIKHITGDRLQTQDMSDYTASTAILDRQIVQQNEIGQPKEFTAPPTPGVQVVAAPAEGDPVVYLDEVEEDLPDMKASEIWAIVQEQASQIGELRDKLEKQQSVIGALQITEPGPVNRLDMIAGNLGDQIGGTVSLDNVSANRAALNSTLLDTDTRMMVGGGIIISKDAGKIAAAIDATQTTIDFGQSMTTSDWVTLQGLDAGGTAALEWLLIGANVSGNVYSVTRDVDGSGANAWAEGSPFAVVGQENDCRIEQVAGDEASISLIRQSSTWDTYTVESSMDTILGAITAGGGVVKLDSAGVSIEADTSFSETRSYKFVDGSGNAIGYLYTIYDSEGETLYTRLYTVASKTTDHEIHIVAQNDATHNALAKLGAVATGGNSSGIQAYHNAGTPTVRLYIVSGGNHYLKYTADGLAFANDGGNIGADVTEFSTDGTLADNSDDAVPTEKAVKTYVDNNAGSGNMEAWWISLGV